MFWKFLAGIGFFIYGMTLLEDVLKKISGRSVKLFLQKHTDNIFKSVVGGTLITALVQSSSVVGSIVLAFIGARIIGMSNALGLIMGANLGTTFTSWIVATVGFKFDVELLALPLAGISMIAIPFARKYQKATNVLYVLLSLGVLFLGLSFMKEAADKAVGQLDPGLLAGLPLLIYILFGVALTGVIQASSAAVAIAMTALYAGIISLPSAAGIVIGSELGTTIKFLIAGASGHADKKRVAVANFLFNLGTCIIAWAILYPILSLFTKTLGISDPVITLVCFLSFINLAAILIFAPFINQISKWLKTQFKEEERAVSIYLSREIPDVPFIAIDAMRLELYRLFEFVLSYVYHEWHESLSQTEEKDPYIKKIQAISQHYHNSEEEYASIKRIETEFLEFHLNLEQKNLTPLDKTRIDRFQQAVRKCIQAAKSAKDIRHNIDYLSNSVHAGLHKEYLFFGKEVEQFILEMKDLLKLQEPAALGEIILDKIQQLKSNVENYHNRIIQEVRENELPDKEVSSLFNINREMYSAKKALLQAIALMQVQALQVEQL